MRPKRVLLMYISPQSGHHRASLALEKALRLLEPGCRVFNVDTLRYMNPILGRLIKKSLGLIRTRPEVWDYLYDNPKVLQSTQHLRKLIHQFHSPKFHALVEETQPDLICCTQAFPCGLVADIKKNERLSIPLVGVITDYFPHSYWVYDHVDFYVVSCEEARQKLSQNGIAGEKILTHGIPVDPKFSVNGKKQHTFLKYGLDPGIPVLLLMGGSQGFGPLLKVVRALERSELRIQLVVLCGNNRRLYRNLKRRERHFRKKVLPLGFVEEVDCLMEMATLLITKPGGLTTAEALAKELPMAILDPVRGQETVNGDFLLKEGLAVRAKNEKELLLLVRELLGHPVKLEAMRHRAKKHQKPRSALDIAQFLLSL